MNQKNRNSDGTDTICADKVQIKKPGGWAQARRLAEQTPPARNRYVDFLRGISIMSVVFGHWLMAAPHYDGTKPHMWHLLAVVPWSQWLTWLFQVMPIFFFVGGYSNLTSWEASKRRGQNYGPWLAARIQRLLQPVLPLLAAWIVLALAGIALNVPRGFIQTGSKIALVPTWFLAIYLLVVMCVPLTYTIWKKYGILTLTLPIACAAIVDTLFFVAHWRLLGWLNYIFIWLTVHQLGYAWRDDRFPSPAKNIALSLLGLTTLLALVNLGPYPLSLVGVPTDAISNTLPPKLPLFALGITQIGLMMAIEKPMRRWLDNIVAWTGTVMINGMIMTIFLWHSTSMMLIIGLGFYLRPEIFSAAPGAAQWWAYRPLWVVIFAIATLPFLTVFSRFERMKPKKHPAIPMWRLFTGCATTCAGLGYLAINGIGGGPNWISDAIALALPFIGAACAGFGPLSRKSNID